MRRVHDEDWSPRSCDPPSHSQSAYSHPPGALPSSYGDYFNSNLPSVGDLGPLQQYIEFNHDPFDETNLPNLPHFTNSTAEDQGNWFKTPQSHLEYNEALPNSMTEPSVTIQTGGETAGPQQELPEESVGSLYGAYRGLFQSSEAARHHRHMGTRFNRQPYLLPEEDSSILDVERNRIRNVGRIYYAMIRGDRAEDNQGSIAMKRWVTCAHYQPDVIEAFAHKVFDCLLAQVKDGFRGWHHNDYVDDDRKGEERDYKVDCAGRLDNIIDALEREKTICEDVMNSGSQIRMFVNAPIAYAARKYQNRLGNSKRGRANGADPNPRPAAKGRKNARSSRARSTTVASERAQSRDTTPNFLASGAVAGPYYRTSLSQHQPGPPKPAYSTPRPHPNNSLLQSAPQDLGGYPPFTSTVVAPMLRHPSATSQGFASYTPVTATAAAPIQSHHPATPQHFPGYIPFAASTAHPPPPDLCHPSAPSQPPTTSRQPHPTSHQRRTYIPPTPPVVATFSTPQTTHFPTVPALIPTPRTKHDPTPPHPPQQPYPQSYAAGPSHGVNTFSTGLAAGNIWHGYAPAVVNGGGRPAHDAFPPVDPLLLSGEVSGEVSGGNVNGDNNGGGEESEQDLFAQLVWAAGLQGSTPAAEETQPQQQGAQHMPTHVSLADIEGHDHGHGHGHGYPVGDAGADAYEGFWDPQGGVQGFSFPAGEGGAVGKAEGKGVASASMSARVDAKGKGKRKRSDDDDDDDVEGGAAVKAKRRRE